MKKLLILTVFMVSLGAVVQAQDVRFGIKGGASLNSFFDENLEDKEAGWGFQAGLLSEINLSERFAVQPEVLFASKGADYKAGLINVEEKLKYIEVPVLVKYKPLEFVNVYAGPQVSFLLHGKYEYEQEGLSYEMDDQDAFKGTDLGFAVGGGLEFGSLFLDARYNMGLLKVHEDQRVNGVMLDNEKAKNYGFQLSVGYFFGQ